VVFPRSYAAKQLQFFFMNGFSLRPSEPLRREFLIRDAHIKDRQAVDCLGLAAFEQYRHAYGDWPLFREKISSMSSWVPPGTLLVAVSDEVLLGAVIYLAPGQTKPNFFQPEWAVMRMLVVSPEARGQGVGRALAEHCIALGRRDGAKTFALHTSELMSVALPMYLRMGFQWKSPAPEVHGISYAVYTQAIE
jgi:GNAT superfamily N-acetyltransferase